MYKYLFLSFLPAAAFAQSQWLDLSSDSSFSNPANWSPSVVPASNSNLLIGVSGTLGFDSGGSYTASSITVSPGVSSIFAPSGPESLILGSGGITLGSGSALSFQLPVQTSASSAWSIGAASVTFSNLFEIRPGTVSLNISNGGSINFEGPSSPAWTGTLAITGSGSFSITAIGFDSNNVDNVTINGSPAMLDGDTLIAAIPEPGTFASLAGLAALVVGVCSRRKKATPQDSI